MGNIRNMGNMGELGALLCDASTGRQINGKSGIPWNKQSTSLVDNCLLGSKYFHLPGKINNFISNNVIITYIQKEFTTS